jgi:cystathionine beta-lyase
LRGVRTLAVRLERQMASGIAVAAWLAEQPEVSQVLHPALPGAPGHELWKRDFSGACSLFGVEFRKEFTVAASHAFAENLKLFGIGASWGGFESLVLPTTGNISRSEALRFEGPLVRLHVGLEDPEDLINDLQTGLQALKNA